MSQNIDQLLVKDNVKDIVGKDNLKIERQFDQRFKKQDSQEQQLYLQDLKKAEQEFIKEYGKELGLVKIELQNFESSIDRTPHGVEKIKLQTYKEFVMDLATVYKNYLFNIGKSTHMFSKITTNKEDQYYAHVEIINTQLQKLESLNSLQEIQASIDIMFKDEKEFHKRFDTQLVTIATSEQERKDYHNSTFEHLKQILREGEGNSPYQLKQKKYDFLKILRTIDVAKDSKMNTYESGLPILSSLYKEVIKTDIEELKSKFQKIEDFFSDADNENLQELMNAILLGKEEDARNIVNKMNIGVNLQDDVFLEGVLDYMYSAHQDTVENTIDMSNAMMNSENIILQSKKIKILIDCMKMSLVGDVLNANPQIIEQIKKSSTISSQSLLMYADIVGAGSYISDATYNTFAGEIMDLPVNIMVGSTAWKLANKLLKIEKRLHILPKTFKNLQNAPKVIQKTVEKTKKTVAKEFIGVGQGVTEEVIGQTLEKVVTTQ